MGYPHQRPGQRATAGALCGLGRHVSGGSAGRALDLGPADAHGGRRRRLEQGHGVRRRGVRRGSHACRAARRDSPVTRLPAALSRAPRGHHAPARDTRRRGHGRCRDALRARRGARRLVHRERRVLLQHERRDTPRCRPTRILPRRAHRLLPAVRRHDGAHGTRGGDPVACRCRLHGRPAHRRRGVRRPGAQCPRLARAVVLRHRLGVVRADSARRRGGRAAGLLPRPRRSRHTRSTHSGPGA